MTLSFTQHTLDKLEDLYRQLGFKVRYEKGNFKTGACMLDHSRIIVVNKFADLENRIISLVSLLRELSAEEELLDEKGRHFFYSLKQIQLSF